MKLAIATVAFVGLFAAGVTPARGQTAAPRTLALAFEPDGTVSLKAQSVTVREILAEWAARCGCFIVNAAQLAGGPLQVPVMFEHAPQAVVLESLLRQAAGYVLTPKRAGSASPSNYDVIYILATSTATSAPIASYASPGFQPGPVATPIVTAGSPDDEIPPVLPARTDNKPATAAPPPTTRSTSPGVSIVPIVPIGNATTTTAPGAPTPGTTPAAPAPRR